MSELTSSLILLILNRAMFSFRNIIILVVVILIGGISFYSFNKNSDTQTISPIPTPIESGSTKNPDVVNIESSEPAFENFEVHSPDGNMNLIMEKTTSGENTMFSFKVEEIETGTKKTVFSKTVLAGTSIQISPNAWSPDNKLFFIKEVSVGSANYFVFKAGGEPFVNGEDYIEVLPAFVNKNTGYTLADVTGWDSETLLHVFSKKEDESRGPSFWFEIPSKAIIQLASK